MYVGREGSNRKKKTSEKHSNPFIGYRVRPLGWIALTLTTETK